MHLGENSTAVWQLEAHVNSTTRVLASSAAQSHQGLDVRRWNLMVNNTKTMIFEEMTMIPILLMVVVAIKNNNKR